MNHLIGLNSFNLYEPAHILEFKGEDLSYDTLFSMDKSIRETVANNPFAEWGDIEISLNKVGFCAAQEDGRTVFWHSRQWDEHLTAFADSFFVTFPRSASSEVAGKIVLATNYPALFALISQDDINSRAFLLVTGNHEVIYPDDKLWLNEDSDRKVALGPVTIIEDQFSSEAQFTKAKSNLISSGYIVAN